MNPFDHFVKEQLSIKHYLRYTDDFIFVHENPVQLVSQLPAIRSWLRDEFLLELHPKKIVLRKASQGIDFLGYVTFPFHRVLRTNTKRRMFKRIRINDEAADSRLQSYLGLLKHCNGYDLDRHIRELRAILCPMDRHLNLHDMVAVADFMESVIDFLPEKDRKPYQQLIDAVRKGEKVSRERLAESAKNIGAVTWASRRALDHFLSTVGAELEWEKLVEEARPATSLLLKRLRRSAGTSTLEETLKSTDAQYAIGPEQEIEISMLRDEVRYHLWESHREALTPMIEENVVEIEAIKKRLKRLRTQADAASSAATRDRLLDTLSRFEDRLYFGGEAMAIESLDAEVSFDAEDAQGQRGDE